MEPRRHDPVGQPRCAPALAFGEPEEGAKTLRVIVDRDPAAVAGVPARNRLVDVGDPDRSQGNTALVQPIKEAIDRAEATADRVFGPPALVTHPGRKDGDLAGVGVLRFARFLEPIHEAQPTHRVAEESLTGLWIRRPVTSASVGQRPLLGRGLDQGHAHPTAFAQIEKTNEIGLMSRDRAQRAPTNPLLRAMPKVAQPFLKQRRGTIVGDGPGVDKQILEHDRISLWSET